MKSFYIIICSLLLFNVSVTAQNVANISGRVVDKNTKEALSFSNVKIISEETSNVQTATVTDDNGRFTVEDIGNGKYKVEISYIGYKQKEIKLLVGNLNKNYDLGRIELEEDASTLGEVTVSAARRSVSAGLDKKTFNIGDNISQSGGSVLEAMRNLPGITVDQEGKVLLRGSDKVTVLIDGKQSSLTGFGSQKSLDNIPAANIEKIEIINNPSAKYDSKGMAGIVNIIYKKNKEKGLNGSAGFSFGLGELTNRKDNLPDIMDKYSWTPKYNPSIALNYHAKNVNVFLQSEGMFRTKVNSNEFDTRDYDNSGERDVRSQFLENRTQQLFNVKAGLDWFIDNNNSITIYGLFEDEYHTDRGDVPYDYIDDGSRKRLWKWAEDENTWYMNYSLNYKHKFAQPGHVIETAFLYTQGKEDELFPFSDESVNHNSADSTHLISKEKVANFTIDYVKPMAAGRLEAGTKIQLRSIPISYKVLPGESSLLDTHLGDWSKYKEDIYAAYLNYVFESKHVELEGGLRAESSHVKYSIDPDNIYYNKNESYSKFYLFPNVRLTYKIDDKNKIALFYNSRVDRPGEFDLRPFPKYDDPEILKTGNPYLRPQYTKMFEASYKMSWSSGSYYISGYYKNITDLFTRVYTQVDGSETLNSITQNLGNGRNFGVEAVVEQELTSCWKANASVNWFRNIIDGFQGTSYYPTAQEFVFDKSKSNTWNMKVNTTINLPKEFMVQGTFVYYAPDIIPQGKTKSRSSLDFGIRKKALKDKLEITLAVTDLLNKFSLREDITGEGFKLSTSNYYETQTVTLGAKYKF